jgi:hypothetical protein
MNKRVDGPDRMNQIIDTTLSSSTRRIRILSNSETYTFLGEKFHLSFV